MELEDGTTNVRDEAQYRSERDQYNNFPCSNKMMSFTVIRTCTSMSAMMVLMLFTSYCVSQQPPGNNRRLSFQDFMTPLHRAGAAPPVPAPVLALLQALRNASQVAGAQRFTAAEAQEWHAQHPCRSRSELNAQYRKRRHKTGNHIPPPSHLAAILREYEALHRTCTRRAGNLTHFFLRKSSVPGCKFVVAKGGNGLGNRALWAVSTLLYAILSQRVLITDPRFFVPSLMCEPFPGSSWAAPPGFPFMDVAPGLWATSTEFLKRVDFSLENLKGPSRETYFYAAQADDDWGPHGRFYCNTEQRFLADVTWISLGGCLYFLPQLFAVPSFGPALEALFPDKVPMTHLLRYAMLPVDPIWARVRRAQDTYLQGADRIVGIQLRYMGGTQEYEERHEVINSRVLECAIGNNILPNISHEEIEVKRRLPGGATAPQKRTVVFIASLYGSLRNTLSKLYVSATGELVGVVQLTQEGGQRAPDFERDSEAFVEVLCLSLADFLVTTPVSTFSELAQGYAGLAPYLLNFKSDDSPQGCLLRTAVDACYQGAPDTYNCPFDADVHHQLVEYFVPSLRPCQSGVHGFQLGRRQ